MDIILAIDDDAGLLKLLELQLSRLGYSIITATSGKAGIDLARTGSPSIILLDVIMPVMDGFATLRALQQEDATSKIPVIMLSAHADKSAVVSAMRLGVSDYIIKPYDINMLKTKIASAIEFSRMQRYTETENNNDFIRIMRGDGRTAILFHSTLGNQRLLDELKKTLTRSFIAMTARDHLVLDLRSLESFEPDHVKVLGAICNLFQGRNLYIIAGRYYGAIVSDSDLEMDERIKLYISPGDMELELSE